MDSYITAIGTAVPRYGFSQLQIASFMAEALQFGEYDRRKLQALYRLTRIDRRHSVLPDYGASPGEYTFFPNTPDLEPFPTVGQRMAIYRREALPLALAAIQNLYPNGKTVQPTHLITVSCTGMYAPGLDIDLIEALHLPTTLHRTAINFMGCYGAFNALKTADAFVRADPSARVLVICLELCTLHFQKKTDEDQLLSNALFADGAAAVLVEAQPDRQNPTPAFRMRTFFCDLWPDGKEDMGWIINDHGFEMTLTSAVPTVIQHGIGKALSRLLEHGGLAIEAITHYALHPGGRKILEVIEQQLGIGAHENRFAYEVLRQYGNMSSATVLFVLKAIRDHLLTEAGSGNILSCAFGPGLTLESMILEIIPAAYPLQKAEMPEPLAADPAFIP